VTFISLVIAAGIASLFLPRFRVIRDSRTRASWYGGRFHGRLTASGLPYNMMGFTAANRTLPLGSWIRVTNDANSRSVILKVTDRGPYKTDSAGRAVKPLAAHPSRDVDLSYWAARKLGMIEKGVSPIRVEVLKKL